LASSDWKWKGKEAAMRDKDCGGAWLVKQSKGKGRKEGEGGADWWGRLVNDTKEKRKRRRGTRAAAGGDKWAVGMKGMEVPFLFFFSFFKLF
jgi:hypothetical protein